MPGLGSASFDAATRADAGGRWRRVARRAARVFRGAPAVGVPPGTARRTPTCARFPRRARGGGTARHRQAHTHLLGAGWQINRKRVQRLWREEGLRVPQRTCKRPRLGDLTAPAERLRAQRPGHVWAFDFQFDQTADGKMLKLLNVVDEFTREALVMHVDRSITADQTVAVLQRLVARRGAPTHIRCGNGPEMTAHALIDWCTAHSTLTSYIDPGAPWQNPFVESFHSRVAR